MANALTLSYLEPDIVLVAFDLPGKGANILSLSVLTELAAILDQLEKRKDLAGLIIKSGKPGTFIAGADIREFLASLRAPKSEVVATCRRGQQLFQRLTQLPLVSVAAIDGIAAGGGAELAVWCDRRVMSGNPKTEIGFPEVKLGLFPGWGGTVRAPRMVGLANALEMITSGENIDATAAMKMGLASDVVPAEKLLEAAIGVVRAEKQTGEYLKDRQRWNNPVKEEPAELGFLGATASAMIQQETKGNYPAPAAALELMLETSQLPVDEALQREAEGMAQLFGSPVNAALINVFFLTDRNKRDTGLDKTGVEAKKVQSVGVIGSGIMGSGIAAMALRSEIAVALIDANPEALARGSKQVLEEAAYDRKKKGPDLAKTLKLAPLFSMTHREEEIAAADFIIEAIIEKEEPKKELIARLEPQLRPTAILASNTSTIPITRLATVLKNPERFCGLHFFNPPRKMKLVEVIRGAKTSDETVATAVTLAKRIGKMPIVVNDGPGFAINRLLFPYMNEAHELYCEGASLREIDRAATAFGMAMGPITLYDLVGLDTAAYAGMTMYNAFPERVASSPLVPAMMRQGRLGVKSGRGFYSYQNKKGRAEDDPTLDKLTEPYRRKPGRKISREEITNRLFMAMLLEATRMVEDKIVRDVRDVDLGVIFGLGFPPFKGGLLYWADTIGAGKLLEMIKPLEQFGPRFKPTEMLLEMAKNGGKFYPPK
ncbi:MAG TPA: 3-hydroxyacyl-CoA dehydrogenase NAD-binding domain-containing protein [Pirellulaceae bacterium]|jgi:3-hydroxyacyl-CoA dehydrogenase/enoyl-CoA hydratase/3-hydroxybutyryl-CoA epimerase/3-hydroxyacyl-CoA dehydrogenase/enoyl-CoA hydratase/3-hydroxybutyryl-CoA epimerase/enoyl-CoA isomerase